MDNFDEHIIDKSEIEASFIREQVFYGEFDGRCPKRVLVKIIGE